MGRPFAKGWLGVSALFVILVASLCQPQVAIAAKGKGVVVYDKGCGSRFIVSAPLGYAILEWFGGNMPVVGDTIVGDFESYGMKSIYNLRAGASTQVWVEDFWLSRDRAMTKMADLCD